MISELVVFFGGIFIGILGVLFGGTAFIALPFWQFLFPSLSYAQILANTKVGSFTRGIASTVSTWKKISFKEIVTFITPFTLGTILGTIITTRLSQSFLLPAILIGILMAELSPKFAHLIHRKIRFLVSFMVGIYGGLIGPGISILIIALLRTYFPRDDQLVFVKLQAPFIELIGTIFVFITSLFYGNILWAIVLYYAVGMFIGGYIGGHILKKTIHVSPKIQRIYIYIIYAVAVIPLVITRFFVK